MAAKKGSSDAKKVICPTCWRRGQRSVLQSGPACVKKLDAGDRFPGGFQQAPETAHVCPSCRGCWEE